MIPFLPSRHFKIIIDSELLNQYFTNVYLHSVIDTIYDLKTLDNPVILELFTPSKEQISASFEGIVEAYSVKQINFVPSKWIKEDKPIDFKKFEKKGTATFFESRGHDP